MNLTKLDLDRKQASRKRTSVMGAGWEPASGGMFYRRSADKSMWELVSPTAWSKHNPATNRWEQIPKPQRTYVATGLELHDTWTMYDPAKLNVPKTVMPNVSKMKRCKGAYTGFRAEFRYGDNLYYYWKGTPDWVIQGEGRLIIDHATNGEMFRAEFEKPATKRSLNRDKWLELKRARAASEKSIKVIKKLGSITPETLPKDFRPDVEADARAYHRLVQSLHPDSPGISGVDMARFGQCVLHEAKRNSNNWQVRHGDQYPSNDDIDRAFDSARARYRQVIYKDEDAYEYEICTDPPHKVRF